MAVDAPNLRASLNAEAKLPLIDAPVVLIKTLEDLNVPKEIQEAILKDPRVYHAFFAQQYKRCNAIINQPEIKALSGDIPEIIPNMAEPVPVGLGSARFGPISAQSEGITDEERSALQEWIQGKMPGLMSAQTKDEVDKLVDEANKLIAELLKDPEVVKDLLDDGVPLPEDLPPPTDPDEPSNEPESFPDLLQDWVNTELKFDKDEDEEKYQKLLMYLASKGDADGLILAIAGKGTYIFSQKLGKVMGALKDSLGYQDKVRAQMELKGNNMTTAELAKFNSDTAKGMTKTNTLFQVVQALTQKKDSMQTLGQSLLTSQNQFSQTVINNLKAT